MKRFVVGLIFVSFLVGNVLAPFSIGIRSTGNKVALQGNIHVAEAEVDIGTEPTGINGQGQLVCSIGSLDLLCYLVKFAVTLWLFVPQLVLGITGIIFDWTLDYTLSSQNYKQNINTFIETGWKILQGISNLIFIFTLLAIAFSLILGAEGTFLGIEPKRAIIWVVVMALLINFSLFFARAVIDVGNILGRAFYSQIDGDPSSIISVSSTDDIENSGLAIANTINGGKSIALSIIAKINPQSYMLQSSAETLRGFDLPTQYVVYLFVAFVSWLFYIFLIYLFGLFAILFFTRTIDLWLSMIMAPLAFSLYAIPKAGFLERFKFTNWIEELTKSAFLVPVFLFFLYLATTALNLAIPVQVITSTGSITQLIGLMIPPILKGLMIGFILLKGRDIAKQMAGTIGTLVSDTAMKAVGSVAQFSAGVATAGGAWALRSTVGAGARSAAMSFKERAEDKNASGFSRFVNRQMYNATARIGKSTFDPRNTKAYDGLQGWTKKNEFDIGKTPYFGNKWNPEVEWRKKKAKEKEKQQNQPNNAPTNTTTTPPPPGGPAPVARPPTTPPGGRSGRPGLPPSGPTGPGAPGASPGRPAPGGGSGGGTPGAPSPNPTAGPGLVTTQAPANQGQNPGNPSGSPKSNSPYNTLGVNESATDEEVRAAYREAMKKNFRAANQEGDSEEKKAASSAMQAAQEAFDQIRKMREGSSQTTSQAPAAQGGEQGPARQNMFALNPAQSRQTTEPEAQTASSANPPGQGSMGAQNVRIENATFTNLNAEQAHIGSASGFEKPENKTPSIQSTRPETRNMSPRPPEQTTSRREEDSGPAQPRASADEIRRRLRE